MNRAERRRLGITREVSGSIELAERERTVDAFSVAVAAAIWDSGLSARTMKRVLTKAWDIFDSVNRNYAKIEDYRLMLKEEAGVDFQYCTKGRRWKDEKNHTEESP